MSKLDSPVRYIKGVGPGRAQALGGIGIYNIADLLNYFPRDYEDRSVITKIRNMAAGNKYMVVVKYTGRYKVLRPRRNLSITKIYTNDDTGYATLTFFNQSYAAKKFTAGKYYIVYGEVQISYGELQILNPECKPINNDLNEHLHIYPVYGLTKNITQHLMRRITKEALNYVSEVDEGLPRDIIERYKLIDKKNAYINIHYPENVHYIAKAKRRLAFQELFEVMLYFNLVKLRRNKMNKGIPFKSCGENDFIDKLPFKLTTAQHRAWEEISNDMESDKQMNRLLQGDVGSGKTVVAALAIYKAIKNDHQVAFMAPTEILAQQHYDTLKNFFKDYRINIGLLTGSMMAKKKNKILKDTYENKINVVIGTHALIQEDVKFNNLGLVITDEQHRFGVHQRSLLEHKGRNCDVLVMTATPIPRSLALIIYGDLDISVIDEMPPGRKPVKTYLVNKDMRTGVYGFIEKLLKKKEQCYVVVPLIEDSDKLDVVSADQVYAELKKEFAGYRVGLLHGKLTQEEKDSIMNGFKSGAINLLVSTTVIEVGVDVPGATAIVIENAERFGLAQLHQLRGRVGRSEKKSYCFLVLGNNNAQAKDRLKILAQTNNGFKISEYDLKLRGPGDFLGFSQHGLPSFKTIDYIDNKVLEETVSAVKYFINKYGIYSQTTNQLMSSIKEKWSFSDEEVTLN